LIVKSRLLSPATARRHPPQLVVEHRRPVTAPVRASLAVQALLGQRVALELTARYPSAVRAALVVLRQAGERVAV
jgi:hypothetical protein